MWCPEQVLSSALLSCLSPLTPETLLQYVHAGAGHCSAGRACSHFIPHVHAGAGHCSAGRGMRYQGSTGGCRARGQRLPALQAAHTPYSLTASECRGVARCWPCRPPTGPRGEGSQATVLPLWLYLRHYSITLHSINSILNLPSWLQIRVILKNRSAVGLSGVKESWHPDFEVPPSGVWREESAVY